MKRGITKIEKLPASKEEMKKVLQELGGQVKAEDWRYLID